MNKELIIDVTPEVINIALAEDKKLVELNVEKCQVGFAVGDIYLGKVKKIMPGLNAAFISIGSEKDAFIHYLDLGPQFEAIHKYVGGVTAKKNLRFSAVRLSREPMAKSGKIANQLAVGQPILVQIAKEAISTKGPRLTSEISLAGRHVVLIPFLNKISISQKIRSNEEKKRLKKIVDSVLPRNYGVIIRTAAVGQSEVDIAQDITSLVKKWEAALTKLKTESIPSILSHEMNRATTIIRDLLNGSFSTIVINDKTLHEEIKQYISVIAPEKGKIVKLYKGSVPIFDNYDISKQIKSLFAKYVSLKKSAYLIIEHTEAMHVIDVNSGNRAKQGNDQEQNSMEVNLAAAEEIARQLRLRDMGGIIVVDFIDLHRGDNRQALHDAMYKFMASDRAKHTILPLSKFGLMQITRQRVRPVMTAESSEVCPTCSGTGKIVPSVLLDRQIENQISYFVQDKKYKYLSLEVSPFVAAFLKKGLFSIRLKWMFKYFVWLKVKGSLSAGFVDCKFFDKKGKQL
ncbi:MAG: Rne/Rng family ribonuclease [Rikenellaceae bacterium]